MTSLFCIVVKRQGNCLLGPEWRVGAAVMRADSCWAGPTFRVSHDTVEAYGSRREAEQEIAKCSFYGVEFEVLEFRR